MRLLEKLLALISAVAAAATVFVALTAVAGLLMKTGKGEAPVYPVAEGGMSGMDGMAGMDGMSGMTGMDGMAGMDGMTGMDGMAGMDGMTGMGGMAGMDGMVGMAAAPAATAVAALDPAAGEKVFKKCAACHDASSAKKNKTGPELWGVVGREAGSVEGFKYSDAMKAHGPWTPEALDAYLADPKKALPGNKMAFAGLKDAADRHNVIAYLAAQSDAPIAPEALPFAAAAGAAAAPAEGMAGMDGMAAPATDAAATEAPAAPAVTYTDPPKPTLAELGAIGENIVALQTEIAGIDYQRARFHPIHFQPRIATATNEECLVCHQEIMSAAPRDASPAGVKASDTMAWYQTLDTYMGDQATFHFRHLQSDLAVATMNLQCTFCHKGNDPREEAPQMQPDVSGSGQPFVQFDAKNPNFTLRKMVNPSTTCLRCHGTMPDPVNIMGLGGPWHEIRADMEDQTSEDPAVANGCLSCHGELFRTNRHNVTYLNAATIEDLAQTGSDTCYGCHGGRQWYRISYPYPRHSWPGMDPAVPDWAKDRPTESDPEYQRPAASN